MCPFHVKLTSYARRLASVKANQRSTQSKRIALHHIPSAAIASANQEDRHLAILHSAIYTSFCYLFFILLFILHSAIYTSFCYLYFILLFILHSAIHTSFCYLYFILIFILHSAIYTSFCYLYFMLLFILHSGIYIS